MKTILRGLTPGEREILSYSALPSSHRQQLARCSSTVAPLKESLRLKKILSYASTPLAGRQPRHFARESIPTPLFDLLTETHEAPQLRPLPRNRLLLRTLCRGKGTLKRNKQGHAFLEIDDQFLIGLYPYLRSQGLIDFTEGAHITVVPSRESFFQGLGPMREIGEQFTFEVEGLYSLANPASWPEVEEVWFFKIHCPELERVRRKHFLPSRPGGHSFMKTLAIKPSTACGAKRASHRINPSTHVA